MEQWLPIAAKKFFLKRKSEAYSGPSQTSNMDVFAKTVNGLKLHVFSQKTKCMEYMNAWKS